MILGADHSRWDWMTGDGKYSPINYAASEARFVFLKACDGWNDTPYYAEEIDATLPPPKLPIPEWLYFTAKIVHPKRIGAPRPDAPNGVFLVTEWDGHFPVPLTTLIGKQVMIDGIACRINAMRAVRLR